MLLLHDLSPLVEKTAVSVVTDDGLIERQSSKLTTFKILLFKGSYVQYFLLIVFQFFLLSSFKRHLKETNRDLCVTRFDVDM